MYSRLLLGSGGGISDDIQRSEQDDSAVICIGLGGTGISCLETVKKEIYNRIRPDDPDAAVPVYSHIKFLAVDSDPDRLHPHEYSDPDTGSFDSDTEIFDLSYKGDLFGLIKQYGVLFESMPEYREWLRYKDISAFRAEAASGGIRQIGRYMLMEKAWDFLNKLNSLIIQAMTGLGSYKLYIHIFSGLSGGTGGGAFLDICYLIRELLSRYRASGYVCGYFFLPDVDLASGISGRDADHICKNGYAALKELDHCMHFGTNGDHWEQSYRSIGDIVSEQPPVDLCHLISARDERGNYFRNAYRHVMNVVADHVINNISKDQNSIAAESEIPVSIGTRPRICGEYVSDSGYCVLGAASAILPEKEILTYLTAKTFEQIGSVRINVPSQAQLDDFVSSNGLKFKSIFEQLIAGSDTSFPIPDISWKDAAGDNEFILDFYNNIKSKAEAVAESNYRELTCDLDPDYGIEYRPAGRIIPLTETVFRSLISISADPEKGPYYALSLLSSPTVSDLVELTDRYLRSVRRKKYEEDEQICSLRPGWEKAQADFFRKPNKKRYQIYTNSTRDLVIHNTRMACFDLMEDLLLRFRRQLSDLADNFMSVFCRTLDDLVDTFRENGEYLDSLVYYHANRDYELSIVTMADVKESLDNAVCRMNMSERYSEFMRLMLNKDGIRAWISGDEDGIVRIVNRYFTGVFSYYSRKPITGFLQEKYDTTDPGMLSERICSDILLALDEKSEPLFRRSNEYNTNTVVSPGYIIVPYTSAGEVRDAVRRLEAYRHQGKLNLRESSATDRISILKMHIGIPLSGFQAMKEYEELSAIDHEAGRYIYEGKIYTDDQGDHTAGRDWRNVR